MERLLASPSFLTPGLVICNNNAAYIGIGANTYKILTELVVYEAGFNVTILDNNGSPLVNTLVKCTQNGQQYQTNASGKIPATIYSTETSLSFTWSSSSTGWSTVNGSLQQYQNITSNYTAAVNGGKLAQTLDLTSEKATVRTSSTPTAQYKIDASLADPGNIITIGTRQYLNAGFDDSNVYAVLLYWEEDHRFDDGSMSQGYWHSELADECDDWYRNKVPSIWKTANAFNQVDVEGKTAECFVPDYDQATGSPGMNGFDEFYFSNDRVFEDTSGGAHAWWTSTRYAYDNDSVWIISRSGTESGLNQTETCGFRPALAIKNTIFK